MRINDNNTTLQFRLFTSILTTIKGSIKNISGNINMEKNKIQSIKILADASTINTSLLQRDLMFKDSFHLNTFTFKQLALEAENFELLGEKMVSNAKITIKNITKTVKLTLKDLKEGMMGEFSLNRIDFNLGNISQQYLDDIKVRFHIQTV